MKKANLMSKVKRRFKVTKDSKHKLPVAENLLNREFKVKEPNKVWVQDIPYIWTKEDFMYLVVVIDLFSRKVGRWSMLDNMRKALVIDVLDMAFNARIPEPELMVHSGIGS
jgi:putative transposase